MPLGMSRGGRVFQQDPPAADRNHIEIILRQTRKPDLPGSDGKAVAGQPLAEFGQCAGRETAFRRQVCCFHQRRAGGRWKQHVARLLVNTLW